MILHVTHGPGSNGSVYTGTPEHLASIWRKIAKSDASFVGVWFDNVDGMHCITCPSGGFTVANNKNRHAGKWYKYLLPALKRVEKGVHT